MGEKLKQLRIWEFSSMFASILRFVAAKLALLASFEQSKLCSYGFFNEMRLISQTPSGVSLTLLYNDAHRETIVKPLLGHYTRRFLENEKAAVCGDLWKKAGWEDRFD